MRESRRVPIVCCPFETVWWNPTARPRADSLRTSPLRDGDDAKAESTYQEMMELIYKFAK